MHIIPYMTKSKGKIVIEARLNIRDHELCTAEALANAGYYVKFVRKSEFIVLL